MVTLEQLVTRAQGELGPVIERDVVECVVRSTIDGLGFHVNDNGEVCDPRPQPVINYPRDQNVRYRGQRRRGTGRR